MKIQADHFMSETMRVQTDHLNITVIAVSLIFSEFFDSEKRMIERRLASLLKNSFLTDSSVSYFLISSVILVIQISAFLKILFSDFLKSLFLISAFSDFFNAVSADLFVSLVNQNMCLCCSKQFIENFEIHCSHFNEY